MIIKISHSNHFSRLGQLYFQHYHVGWYLCVPGEWKVGLLTQSSHFQRYRNLNLASETAHLRPWLPKKQAPYLWHTLECLKSDRKNYRASCASVWLSVTLPYALYVALSTPCTSTLRESRQEKRVPCHRSKGLRLHLPGQNTWLLENWSLSSCVSIYNPLGSQESTRVPPGIMGELLNELGRMNKQVAVLSGSRGSRWRLSERGSLKRERG
jgi:hypothetical protein